MKNMLAFAAFVVLAVGGVGFYLDWFNIRSTPAPTGTRSYTLDVDTDKIGDDLKRLEEKAQKKLAEKNERAKEKVNSVEVPRMPPADVNVNNVFGDR